MSVGADWSDLAAHERPGWITGKGVLATVAAAGVLLAAGYLLAVAWRTGYLFPLERVELAHAPEQLTGEEVREALAPHLHRNMLRLDVRGARRALESLPWVDEVTVQRVWPETLSVTIRERQAVARWGGDSLLDEAGEVFSPPPATFPGGLPQLRGAAGQAGEVLAFHRRLERLFHDTGVNVTSLTLTPRGAWQARFDDGVELAIGREQPVQRVERFVDVLPALEGGGWARIERVDLRYPNGFAVAWSEAAAAD